MKRSYKNIPPFQRILRVNFMQKIPEMHIMIDAFKQIADMSS